jgi:hypothetical protein
MVNFVFIITHKDIPYSSYQVQSLSQNKMWESVRGSWNTIDLFYNAVNVKFPFFAPHVISYITEQDRRYR